MGFFLFVVAWVFLIVVGFGFPYSPKYSTAAVAFFSTLPWTLLAKGIQDLADASQGALGAVCALGWWLVVAVWLGGTGGGSAWDRVGAVSDGCTD